jgi:putative phosphoesterase
MTGGVGSSVRVGVVSDTHGLLRPEVLAALQGSQQIIHAGDIGGPEILERLGGIAPVTAVRGNVDHGAWTLSLPGSATLEVGDVRLHVVHDADTLLLDPEREGFAVVVSGHTHRPSSQRRSGMLFFNPGSAKRLCVSIKVALSNV